MTKSEALMEAWLALKEIHENAEKWTRARTSNRAAIWIDLGYPTLPAAWAGECVCPNPALHQWLAENQPIDPSKCYKPAPTKEE